MNKIYHNAWRGVLACVTTGALLLLSITVLAATLNNPMTEDLQGAGYAMQGVGTLVATNIAAGEAAALSLVACDPWVDARAFGTNLIAATISAALTAIGSGEATLLLAPGNWDISSSLAIPENITLKFMRGAVLDIDAGRTITINGNIEAGLYRIFDDADTNGYGVVFGGAVAKSAPVMWWGASPSASAAVNNTAFQQAINCLHQTGVPLHVPGGIYHLSAPLNHKVVDIYGDGIELSYLNNTAMRCMQADPVCPATGVSIKNILIKGMQFGYHSNGKVQERLLFERVYLAAAMGDTNVPPAYGYGMYCNSEWKECRLLQCLVSPMGWFSGGGMRNILLDMTWFNATGNPLPGGNVLYIGESNPDSAHTFIVRDCCIEKGAIKAQKLPDVVIEDTSIFDPTPQGVAGLVVGNCESIRLSNIMAYDTTIKYTGTVSRSFINNILCYNFDWNRQPSVFAYGVTAQQDNWTPTIINDSSVLEYEGALYGRAFMKRSVSVCLPADTSATQTWYRVLHTTTRKSWITEMRITAESNIAGTNTNYATLRFLGRNGTAYIGSYAFTNGNSMTAFQPKELPFTDASNLANESLLLQKTVTGTGRQLPDMTITIEYYDQGVL